MNKLEDMSDLADNLLARAFVQYAKRPDDLTMEFLQATIIGAGGVKALETTWQNKEKDETLSKRGIDEWNEQAELVFERLMFVQQYVQAVELTPIHTG